MRLHHIILVIGLVGLASCAPATEDSAAYQQVAGERDALASELARIALTPEPTESTDAMAELEGALTAATVERDRLRLRVDNLQQSASSLGQLQREMDEMVSLVEYLDGLTSFYRGLVAREVLPTLIPAAPEPVAGRCPLPDPLPADTEFDPWVGRLHDAAIGIASGVNGLGTAFSHTDQSVDGWIYQEPARSAALRLIVHEQAATRAVEQAALSAYAPLLPLEDYSWGYFENRIFPAMLTAGSLGLESDPVPGGPTSTPCGWGSSLVDWVNTVVAVVSDGESR